jgi:hypothetical protein
MDYGEWLCEADHVEHGLVYAVVSLCHSILLVWEKVSGTDSSVLGPQDVAR